MSGYVNCSIPTREMVRRGVLNELQRHKSSAHRGVYRFAVVAGGRRTLEELCALPGTRGSAECGGSRSLAFTGNSSSDRKRHRRESSPCAADRAQALYFRGFHRDLYFRRSAGRLSFGTLRSRRHKPPSTFLDSPPPRHHHPTPPLLPC